MLKAVLQLLAVVCLEDVENQYGGSPHVLSYNVIIFCTQNGYFTISNGIFKFNFLAVVVSEISGGPKFTLRGPAAPDAH